MSKARTDSKVLERVSPSHYALKQVFSKNAIIAWSHRNRFRHARQLLKPHAGKRLVDYGRGDGTLLAAISEEFPDAIGVDPDLGQINDCRRRLAKLPTVRFFTVKEIESTRHEGFYDVVICMEVLEHCVDGEIEKVIGDLWRLTMADGTVIVSVPIEIGPSLLGKHLLRALASWRSLGDYQSRERYTVGELLRSVVATERTRFVRELNLNSSGPFHAHKGFNWRALRTLLRARFEVCETRFSPFDVSGELLSSQAWFVCRRHLT